MSFLNRFKVKKRKDYLAFFWYGKDMLGHWKVTFNFMYGFTYWGYYPF